MKRFRLVAFVVLLIISSLSVYAQKHYRKWDNGLTKKMFLHSRKTQKLHTHFIGTSDGKIHDLRSTLDRIRTKIKFPHRRDGTIFKNNELNLPKQKFGHYHEFVHPTPGVSHAGKMRIVKGRNGKKWFSSDHYHSLIPIRGKHVKFRKH